MKYLAFAINLLFIGLAASLVGCNSTIPATDITPTSPHVLKPLTNIDKIKVDSVPFVVVDSVSVFLTCPNALVTREIHRTSSFNYGYKTGIERIIVGGEAVEVFFVDSTSYSYDSQRRLVRQQRDSPGNRTDANYSYAPGKLTIAWTNFNIKSATTQVDTSSKALNDQGYEAGFHYDTDGRRIRQPGNQFDYENWVRGNRIYMYHAGEDYLNSIESSFTINRLNIPNPHQYEGLGNKNLLLLDVYTVYNRQLSVWQTVYRADSYYFFDANGLVRRKITVYKPYGEGTLPLAGGRPNYTDVTDYEYACP